jgi:FtsP/CotA-like multicopper oxidase with cupredoxin domain
MANDRKHRNHGLRGAQVSRREVMRGGAALAALGGAALVGRAAVAGTAAPARATGAAGTSYVPQPETLQHVFQVKPTTLDPDGKKRMPGITVNGSFPGPEIRVREGDVFRVLVENRLGDAPTTIHWHGMLVPAGMDGVPQISNLPIPPGQMYVYEYPLRQTGTYWYHSHVGFQEQVGLFGPLVVEEKDDPVRADHDAVVILSDWLHRSPEEVFAGLRAGGTKPDAGMAGMKMAAKPDAAPAAKPAKADLADIEYAAFLLNGKAPAAPWTLAASPGERIRLRIINAGSSTYFKVSLDRHELQVTHADGLAVEPVVARHLLMGMAECYDVVVTLKEPGSYTLHAVSQDGSGQALGVLHTPDAKPQPDGTMPTFDDPPLQYAQLRAPSSTVLPEGPSRVFRLPLQGDMKKYVWMIDGQAWPDASPLEIRRGDRVELEMKNETMMWHPMHLHGHFFRVLNGAGDFCPLKHTVNVAPGETVRIEFTADNPGRWFFHCHNLYHLEAGMAREFVYVT